MTVSGQTQTIKLSEKASATAGVMSYQQLIRSAVYGLWSGERNLGDFIADMFITIQRGFTRAWYEGASECGMLPEDLTIEEKQRMADEILTEQSYIVNFGNDILNGLKGEALLRTHTVRVPMWVNRYSNIKSIARMYACGDEKLKWVMSPLVREHCKDCLMLDGRVYRASVWKTLGWEPRSHDLACGGYKCGCEFQLTSDPITRGRPPRRI